MAHFTPFIELPREIRMVEIFPQVTMGGCLRLLGVCRLFNHEISNDYLRERCYAHFPELATISAFIEPLLESVEKPWGWICYSLICEKVNEELIPDAQKLAKAVLPRFQTYFQKLTAQVQEKYDRNLVQQELLFATGEDDHDGVLFQIKQAYQIAMSEQEQDEYHDLDDRHPELFQVVNGILDQTPLKSTILEFDSQPLEEALQGDLKKRVTELVPGVRSFAEQKTRDPTALRIVELILKGLPEEAHWNQLYKIGKNLTEETPKQARILADFRLIDDSKLELFAATTLHRILSHLPHMKNWLFLEPRKDLILKIIYTNPLTRADLLSDPLKIADIRALVDAFPPPCPSKIKDLIRRGQPEQNETPWDNPRLRSLGLLLQAINFIPFLTRRGNPMLDLKILSDFLKGQEELMFDHLPGHPDLEKKWKHFEATGSFYEGSPMKYTEQK